MSLLTTTDSAANRVRRCFRRARAESVFRESYLAATNGLPRLLSGAEETVDVLSKRCGGDGESLGGKRGHVEPVITRHLRSKSFIRERREDAKRHRVKLDTLAKSKKGPAALVKIQTTSVR